MVILIEFMKFWGVGLVDVFVSIGLIYRELLILIMLLIFIYIVIKD